MGTSTLVVESRAHTVVAEILTETVGKIAIGNETRSLCRGDLELFGVDSNVDRRSQCGRVAEKRVKRNDDQNHSFLEIAPLQEVVSALGPQPQVGSGFSTYLKWIIGILCRHWEESLSIGRVVSLYGSGQQGSCHHRGTRSSRTYRRPAD